MREDGWMDCILLYLLKKQEIASRLGMDAAHRACSFSTKLHPLLCHVGITTKQVNITLY
jgi:hypothetical protein